MRNSTSDEDNLFSSWQVISMDYPRKQYQEPERDEQGTFYGYKALIFLPDYGYFVSPSFPVEWNRNGNLTADAIPNTNNENGIYSLKSFNKYELGSYARYGMYRVSQRCVAAYVKIALSGVVIEGETGFRSQHAQIVAVAAVEGPWISFEEFGAYYGYWKNREDSYRRAESDSYQVTKEPWYRKTWEEGRWDWTTDYRPELADEEDEESGS